MEQLDDHISSLEIDLKRKIELITAKDVKITECKNVLAKKNGDIACLKDKRDTLLAKLLKKDDDLCSLTREITAQSKTILSKENDIERLENDIDRLSDILARRNGDIACLKDELKARDDDVASLREKIDAQSRTILSGEDTISED